MRTLTRALAAALVVFAPAAAVAGQASTTRIETRPFYGATVTLESGVRVFRPLPPHERVIINPGGRTPLSLSFEENRTYNYDRSAAAREPTERDGAEGTGGIAGYGPASVDERGARMGSKRNVPIARHRSPSVPAGHAAHPAARH